MSLAELVSERFTDPTMDISFLPCLRSPRLARVPVEILLEQYVEEGVDHDAGAMIIRRFSECV